MDFEVCYSICNYMNECGRGCFSAREVANNAFILYQDIEQSRARNEITENVMETIRALYEFEDEEATEAAENLIIACKCEVKPVKARINLNKQMYRVFYAMLDLSTAIDDYESATELAINDLAGFTEFYPFSLCLDEAVRDARNWAARCAESLFKK